MYPPAKDKLAKRLTIISLIVSAILLSTMGGMRRIKFELGVDFSFIPPLIAVINTMVAICLVIAYVYIKKGDYKSHRAAIITALGLSALFFIAYVLYHFTTPETTYCKEGGIRYIYYFFLFTHIVLAGLSLPFILITFVRGFTFQVAKHRKMARWVYPIWLYVAITGPICYLMLKSCY
ncbi:MAG: DUF420 domain-containing protein [Saprospiraceae bacterium]|nr:MAG: YozB protein [Bacteroidetes bacterium OLB9]MCO6464345.1 DUF420 domain-containing protein [Saprospiraceae bacterium]MCZ2337238.1 DUF420 domain-containing protein [Chitinophagales bacterium]